MCNRYYFSAKESGELQAVVDQLKGSTIFKAGIITLGDCAPILVSSNGQTQPILGVWGFPSIEGRETLTEVCAERAAENPAVSESLSERRCVVPSSGFYASDKCRFTLPEQNVLYMAGLYCRSEDETRFTILTTVANASVEATYTRMPIILLADEIDRWLETEQAASNILGRIPPELVARDLT